MRHQSLRCVAYAATIACACLLARSWAATVPARFVMGTNFSGISDWGTEPIWKDYMKQSRTWCPQRSGMSWGEGWPLAVDSLNWITSLDAGQTVDCPLFGSTSDNWNSMNADSTYYVLFDGAGTVGVWNAQSYSTVSPGRIQFRSKAASAPFLQITATTPSNYVRNIRIVRRDMEASYQAEPWDPAFLTRWHDFPVVRFMDWQSTNNNPVSSWSRRTRRNSQTQAMESGVALEHMIDFCNRTLTEPWFCIPHRADDNYVRQFATMVRDSLDPRLKAYIEYSNECWNSMFEQTSYCDSNGVAEGLGSSSQPWEAGWRWYGRRSKQIFTIFEQVFGGTSRFVRVIASQMNSYVTDRKMEQDSVWRMTDAVAIAPYFGGRFDGAATAGTVQNWTVNQLLDSCLNDIRGGVRDAIQDHIDLVARYNGMGGNMKLTAYEGGQHLVGTGGAENNETLTNLFIAANRAARMYDLYIEYFEQWASLGGTVFCQFSSLCTPSKWGSWCALETVVQDTSTAPKYRALMEMIRRYPPDGIGIRGTGHADGRELGRFRVRTSGGRLVLTGASGAIVTIFRSNGAVVQRLEAAGQGSAKLSVAPGVYVVRASRGRASRGRTKVTSCPIVY